MLDGEDIIVRTIETKVYKFNELSDEAKLVAIEGYREGLQYDSLEEFMREELIENLLPKYGITPNGVQVRYSLSYRQGDGASFTGDIEWDGYRATIETNHWGIHYSHARSVDVKELNSLETDEDAPDEKWAELQGIVEKIGKELERFGYEEIEYQSSDETIINCLVDDYEFYTDGSLV